MQINQLSSIDTLSLGDLIAVWSNANGDTRKASLSALVTLMQASITTSRFQTQYYAPQATGFVVTAGAATNLTPGNSYFLLITPGGAYASGAVQMPEVSTCKDGQEVLCSCTLAVTSLTVSGNGATAVVGAPTTLAAGGFFRMRFDAVFKSWYRVG